MTPPNCCIERKCINFVGTPFHKFGSECHQGCEHTMYVTYNYVALWNTCYNYVTYNCMLTYKVLDINIIEKISIHAISILMSNWKYLLYAGNECF